MSRDYVFHVNWDDTNGISYRIGMLAKINEVFYFSIRDKQRAEKAYRKGFVGIPGFNPKEIHMSHSMFDFFKNRAIEKENEKICEELAQTRGKSMVDSFSVDEITGRTVKKYKELILRLYQIQEQKARIEIENKNNNKPIDTKRAVEVRG